MSVLALGVMIMGTEACKKKPSDPVPPKEEKGSFKVRFNYVFGPDMKPWKLGETYVHSKTDDTLTFTMFRYYVSNIRLKKPDGTWWIQPESYYLLSAASETESTIDMKDVPVGDYTAMEYTMGVDSARNVSGANDGALSFTNNMFWDWNTGYIMLKAEGVSPNAPGNNFLLHYGGFSGEYNVVTTKTADMSAAPMKITTSSANVVKLQANVARLWHSSPGVDSIYVIHSLGPVAKQMATDFYNGIVFTGIE